MQPVRVLCSLLFFALLLAICIPLTARAQDSRDFAVMLQATTQREPAYSITLHWNTDPYATYYSVERKLVSENVWEYLGDTDPTGTSFTDSAVELGKGYEYAVRKLCKQPITDDSILTYQGTGYIYAGIDILPPDKDRHVLIIVDNTMADPLASELERLEQDLQREGWSTTRSDVPRTELFSSTAVQQVKSIITDAYTTTPNKLTSVLIIGRVAVPYSGRIAPDGHPDHLGAWPADSYYADVDGVWTDNTVNDDTTELGRPITRNVIGDGKFDQSSFPSQLDIQVGRVDFYDMSDFSVSETELLRRYLNKDHRYRTGQIVVQEGGIIDDNFPASSLAETFSSSGWRNIALFGGEQAVRAADFFTTLDTASYLWAYGCGPGSYSSSQGVGSTIQCSMLPVNAVFTMLFGSYFGDWDSPNNFLRAAIASDPSVLTCVWAARPHWYFHHMLMGEPIGFSTLVSQNNSTTYIPNYNYNVPGYPNGVIYTTGNRQAHIALMGDPTLRVYKGPVAAAPVSLVVNQLSSTRIYLQWTAPAQPVSGYQVFRALSPDDPFQRITSDVITGTEFVDDTPAEKKQWTYMVRAVIRRESGGGTYLEPGPGTQQSVAVTVADQQKTMSSSLLCFPNPAARTTVLSFPVEHYAQINIDVFNATGVHIASIFSAKRAPGQQTIEWNLTDIQGNRVAPGLYLVRCNVGGTIHTTRVVVQP